MPKTSDSMPRAGLDEVIADFDTLDSWEDRYRYLIELGRELAPLSAGERISANKVEGCASQVWLAVSHRDARLVFKGDSDAHIVRGLIALLIRLYSGRRPADIRAGAAEATFRRLGLSAHLTPQRSNGFRAMTQRIAAEAARRA